MLEGVYTSTDSMKEVMGNQEAKRKKGQCYIEMLKKKDDTISISIAMPKFEDVSEILMPKSSPLMLPATLTAGVIVRLAGL